MINDMLRFNLYGVVLETLGSWVAPRPGSLMYCAIRRKLRVQIEGRVRRCWVFLPENSVAFILG